MKAILRAIFRSRTWIPIAGITAALWSIPSLASERAVLTGAVINMSGGTREASETFTLFIDHLTPDAAYDTLVQSYRDKGEKGLQDAVWDLKPLGQLQIGHHIGAPLAVARASVEGGRRVLRILTDRSMEYYEVTRDLRTTDYPFSYLEITLDEKGLGEGNFIPVAKVAFKKNGDMDVTNYTALPFKLTHIKQEPE
jgi:hypothetical protein